jgi:hypothetical protein
MTAPGWFADPAGQHVLRYWDGTMWTAHVADATLPPRPPARPPRRAVGWAGLALCIAGAVAVAVPVIMSLDAPDSPSVRLDGSRQQLSLTPDTTYGVYIDDRDNSGYSLSCSAEDDRGRPIRLRTPSWHVTTSDTEMLEYVYDSGSGEVTMTCSADDASVSTRPSTPAGRLVLVTVLGGVAGVLGLAMLIIWLVDRLDPGRRPSAAG